MIFSVDATIKVCLWPRKDHQTLILCCTLNSLNFSLHQSPRCWWLAVLACLMKRQRPSSTKVPGMAARNSQSAEMAQYHHWWLLVWFWAHNQLQQMPKYEKIYIQIKSCAPLSSYCNPRRFYVCLCLLNKCWRLTPLLPNHLITHAGPTTTETKTPISTPPKSYIHSYGQDGIILSTKPFKTFKRSTHQCIFWLGRTLYGFLGNKSTRLD